MIQPISVLAPQSLSISHRTSGGHVAEARGAPPDALTAPPHPEAGVRDPPADASPATSGRLPGNRPGGHMRKQWIIAGLLALTMAGCGSSKSSTSEGPAASPASGASTATQAPAASSAGHTSEWTAAATTEAENDLNKESQGEHLSAAFKGCLIKGVEETFSPAEYKKDNAENKEAGKAKGVAEACAKKYPPTGKE